MGPLVAKETSCETELVASNSSTSSLQNMKNYSFYQAEYPESKEKKATKPGSDGMPRKRSRGDSYEALAEGQSISFISNSSAHGRSSTVELVPCLKNSRSRSGRGIESSSVQSIATLPRQNRETRARGVNSQQAEMDYVDHQGRNSVARLSGQLSRSSSQGDGRREERHCPPPDIPLSSSRPRMSTFCHILPPPLLESQGGGGEFLAMDGIAERGKQSQAVVSRSELLQPESV